MKEMVVGVAVSLGMLLVTPVYCQKAEVRLNRVAVGEGTAANPRLCADGDRVFVVWSDSRNGLSDIYFQRSTDRGETWLEEDVRLDTDAPGSASSLPPQIVRSGEILYVLWMEVSTTSQRGFWLNVSRDAGKTWLPNAVLVGTTQSQRMPNVGPAVLWADGLGLYVVYRAASTQLNPDTQIYFNRSLDGGETWLPADVQLSSSGPNPAYAESYLISGRGGGVVYVAWTDYQLGSPRVFFRRSLDAGETWLPAETRVSTAPPGKGSVFATRMVAAGDRIFIAWQDERNRGPTSRNGGADIFLNYSLDRGATWQASDIRLDTDTPGAARSSWPDVSVDGDRVYVVWEDERQSVRPYLSAVFCNYSEDGGATWQACDTRLSQGANTWTTGRFSSLAAYPRVVSTNGTVVAVWNEDRAGVEDVYWNRSTDGGASWLASELLLEAGTGSSVVVDVASGSDHVYVVWTDSRLRGASNATDIYFNVPFALHSYGEATGGANDCGPGLAGYGRATIGSTVQLSITDAPVSDLGVLAVGTTPRVSTPAFGGALHLNPLMVLPVTVDSDGRATLPVPIPDDEALVGEGVLFQFLGIDAAAPAGVSMSNGLELRIG